MGPTVQRFGGNWSVLKTEAVRDYLAAFVNVMKNLNYGTVYIDAFAGSGAFAATGEPSGQQSLITGEAPETIHQGSARNALEVEPPFDEYFLIDESARNVKSLEQMRVAEFSHRKVTIIQGDANTEVKRLCAGSWGSKRRGVIFLDPFGTQVDWQTLVAITRTQALDVWYLFPLAGTYRNAPINLAAMDGVKRATLIRLLGTDGWETFYDAPPADAPRQASLFGTTSGDPKITREPGADKFEAFVFSRLKGIFPHVEPPQRLPLSGAPLFSLFFAVSNPSPKAIGAAQRIASHILTKMR